jgi:hypothetical protein
VPVQPPHQSSAAGVLLRVIPQLRQGGVGALLGWVGWGVKCEQVSERRAGCSHNSASLLHDRSELSPHRSKLHAAA